MSTLSFTCRHRRGAGFELDVAFEVGRPVTSIFGPSGSGKTSVLETIAGIVRPDWAKVYLGSTALVDSDAGICVPPERRHIGYVFQDHLLFPHMTVDANLRYGEHRGRGGRHIEFERVVEVLEIADLLKRYPQNLSGGESQRVALGRALLSGPALLLMDEPLAALDEALKLRVLAYLERVVNEWKIPTLFVSHGQAEVRRLADWVVVIKDGRVVAEGEPEDALGQPGPLGLTNAAGPVNLLRIEQARFHDSGGIGHVGDQKLSLPPAKVTPPTPFFVEFVPAAVIISRQDVTGISTRNHLHGVVRQLVKLPDRVFVAVDVGQIIWAELTQAAVSELELNSGTTVTCLIKTRSLSVVG